ncbi:MAG: adenosylcobinamide-GDP ribazoletransferase [Lentilitoribacter sp.]
MMTTASRDIIVAFRNQMKSITNMSYLMHIDKLAQAIGFLSRYPVPSKFFQDDDGSMTETSGYYVIAGVLIALPFASIAVILAAFDINSMLIAAILVASLAFATGGLHEDGLSDCVDGFWGSSQKDKILVIMKDSRLGTYGTLALIFSILIKFVALTLILDHLNAFPAFIAILVASGCSRGVMVWHWSELPAARDDGVAASVGEPSTKALQLIMISITVLGAISIIFTGFLATSLAVIFAAAISYYFTKLSDDKIDGHTGDTIGATQQLSEIAILIGFALIV